MCVPRLLCGRHRPGSQVHASREGPHGSDFWPGRTDGFQVDPGVSQAGTPDKRQGLQLVVASVWERSAGKSGSRS